MYLLVRLRGAGRNIYGSATLPTNWKTLVFFITVYKKNHKLFLQDTRHTYNYASGPYASTISIYKFDRPFEDQNKFTCNVIYETNIGPFRPSVGKPAALSTRLRYVQFVILYLYFTVQIKTIFHGVAPNEQKHR